MTGMVDLKMARLFERGGTVKNPKALVRQMIDEIERLRAATAGIGAAAVIETAAGLVDNGQQVSEEYRRGVVELAAQLCLHADDPLYHDDAITVMGYAVCGVNREPRVIECTCAMTESSAASCPAHGYNAAEH